MKIHDLICYAPPSEFLLKTNLLSHWKMMNDFFVGKIINIFSFCYLQMKMEDNIEDFRESPVPVKWYVLFVSAECNGTRFLFPKRALDWYDHNHKNNWFVAAENWNVGYYWTSISSILFHWLCSPQDNLRPCWKCMFHIRYENI